MNIRIIFSLIAVLAFALPSKAQEEILIFSQDSPKVITLLTSRPQATDSIITPESVRHKAHFSWGAGLGSSFDLTDQALTSFDISAGFGYSYRSTRFMGLGAAIHFMINNSSRAYPVYFQYRTTFTSAQKFVFLDTKAGISFISLYDRYSRRPLYAGIGLGFTLASSRTFSSHIILDYSFTPLRNMINPETNHPLRDLHQAVIRLGCAF